MPPVKSAERDEPKRHNAAAVLVEGINTFSQSISSSQRKRKRGVPTIIRSDDEAIGSRLDVKDLDIITGNSRLRSSLKGLVNDVNVEVPSTFNHQKLYAPVPHTTQARLNRCEAYSTTKQTFNKWTDAVQSARSAEQLIFPLGGNVASSFNNIKYHSSHQSGRAETRPSTKLECRISKTLSLTTQDPDKNKYPTDSEDLSKSKSKHVKTKTAHLRMERELLLRKEAKAKRLRKIKSKSYRRILRKDLRKFGNLPSSSENANADGTGGTLEGGDFSRIDSDSPERDLSDDIRLRHNIDESMLPEERNDKSHPSQRLFTMKFMEKAKRHDALKDQYIDVSETQEIPKGRRMFHDGLLPSRAGQIESLSTTNKKGIRPSDPKFGSLMDFKTGQIEGKANPWLYPTNNNSKLEASLAILPAPRTHEDQTLIAMRDENGRHTAVLDIDSPSSSSTPPSPSLSGGISKSIIPPPASQALNERPGHIRRNEQSGLLARAFASDNIMTEILDERPENSSRSDREATGLQGWGTWGISPGNTGRSRKQKGLGLKASENQQTKVEKVSLNQQLCKKGLKYLATNLPYPFETSDQYERSLRFPIGQEWSTKQTHQTLTAPRVIVKGGTVITPLS
ncbi:hypothetical protein TWF506_002149 [Arthrobotrys conoides]|uniref:Uncharacterized protein n=1 Tax=Arthrobotrys conoides TaxID=74498 RepID=A0AAN8NEH4_9PEZI